MTATPSRAAALVMPRGRAGSAAATTAFAGISAAVLTSVAEAPWATHEAIFVGALLLVPAGLVAAVLSGALVAALPHLHRGLPRKHLAFSLVGLGLAGAIVAVGFYLSNVLLVAPMFGLPTLIGYGITALLAAIAGIAARAWLLPSRLAPRVAVLGPSGVLALLAAGGSAGTVVVDVLAFPLHYWRTHLVLEGVALFGAAMSMQCAVRRRPTLTRRGGIGLLGVLIVSACLARRDPTATLSRYPTVHRRAWSVAGSLFDSLGPRPLAAPTNCVASVPTGAEVVQRAHRVVVLLTIDAFRCGFGTSDRQELRDACPALTQELTSGAGRLDAHAAAPITVGSIAAMQTVDGEALGSKLRRAGYSTRVIATHPNILKGAIPSSFDVVDADLVPIARSGFAITSDAVAERALAALRPMAGDGGSHFLWAHFFDPHEPYTASEGRTFRTSQIGAYAAEVRRTDAAVARVVEAVRAFADGEALVVVTADHGEEFGEHGGTNHGATLFEEATRIPLLAWSSGTTEPPVDLPAGSVDVGRFLYANAVGGPYASSSDVFLQVDTPHDEQVGLVWSDWKLVEHRTLGYAELYDLFRDRNERVDVSRSQAGQLAQMRCRLSAMEAKGR